MKTIENKKQSSKGFKIGKSLVEATKDLKGNSIARTRLKTGDCCK